MLRPYFLHHRELLGELCRAAYETVRELMVASVSDHLRIRPGFVAVVQTFGGDLRWNPHVHALASAGGWDAEHSWIPLPHLDARSAELVFRDKVLGFLSDCGLLDDERRDLLLTWQEHTGFSADNSVRLDAGDTAGLDRLARYLLRSPVSLERLSWNEAEQTIRYASRHGHDEADQAGAADRPGTLEDDTLDPLEFVARLLLHVAEPRLHAIRYLGAYAAVVRARRRREAQSVPTTAVSGPEAGAPSESQTPGRAARPFRWATLIRRVYEVDPLICPRCGAEMAIIAFILDPAVISRLLRHVRASDSSSRAPPGRQRPLSPLPS